MAEDELDVLRAEAEAAGVKVDRRWGADRLRSELEAWLAAERGEHHPPRLEDMAGEDNPDRLLLDSAAAQPEPVAAAEPKQPVHRAGGHADYDDGRGWVLDRDEPEPVGASGPVEPGTAGLPGHPVMAAAGWTLTEE